MDNSYLAALIAEITPEILGRSVVRASVERHTLLLDLRLSGRQLVVSLNRTNPAIYLSSRTTAKPISERSNSTFFLSSLRKHIVDARVVGVRKHPMDRIVQLDFERTDAGDNIVSFSLTVVLTGRSANAYLVDSLRFVSAALVERDDVESNPPDVTEEGNITGAHIDLGESISQTEVLDRFFSAHSPFGPQLKNEYLFRCHDSSPAAAFKSLMADLYDRPPVPLIYSRVPLDQIGEYLIDLKTDLLLSHIELRQARGMLRRQFESLSEAADEYYFARRRALVFRDEYAQLKQRLAREINKRVAVLKAIESDRVRFDKPENFKRIGDLILANLANATISGSSATVVDYYDPDQREIQIEIPSGLTLQEAAQGYFTKYQKARRAQTAIATREGETSQILDPLRELLLKLEQEPSSDRVNEVARAADRLLGVKSAGRRGDSKRTKTKGPDTPGRRFKSSDGYEIIVGRNDRDNDALTFRIAKSNDIWLHAADYPGSHAIIRNPSRSAPPHRTITEAAELAAFYSQAKGEGKAAVHYTQKKFVSKPPRSKPGLVRLSSFKTIVVEPRCAVERLG